jgi:hypothetical protein
MNDIEKAKAKCNAILIACVGEALVSKWWYTPNRAFDLKTPAEVWETDDWISVYKYLLGQMNGDYL